MTMNLFSTTLADGPGPGHDGFWLGKALNQTTDSGHTEWLFMFIMWVNILSFVVLMAILGWFILKYRRGAQKTAYQASPAHNTILELSWSIIPFVVMVPIFYWGLTGYVAKLAAPSDAEEIYVVGKKWNWDFKYQNGAGSLESTHVTKSGIESPVFVAPAGRSVRMTMRSEDVIHAFYIPDFRIKLDVIPNRYTSINFTPRGEGVHNVFCAEYCGDKHSEMHAQLRVESPEKYRATLLDWSDPIKGIFTPTEIGTLLWKSKGCNSCHSLDGSKNTGPTWKGSWGETRKFTDGSTATVDENYIRESILYSQKHIVEGYPASMPVFAGQLNDNEVFYLTLFIKSLGNQVDPDTKAKMDKKLQDQPDLPRTPPK